MKLIKISIIIIVSVLSLLYMYGKWLNIWYEERSKRLIEREIPDILQSIQGKINECAMEKVVEDLESLLN